MRGFLKKIITNFLSLTLFFGFWGCCLFALLVSHLTVYKGDLLPQKVAPNTILHLKLEGEVVPYRVRPLLEANKISLAELEKGLVRAAADPNISALLVEIGTLHMGAAGAASLAYKMRRFAAEKPLYCHTTTTSQATLLLASQAHHHTIHPLGVITLEGQAIKQVFLKKALDYWGIEPILFQAGTYKNAGEIFTKTKMSQGVKKELKAFLLERQADLEGKIAKYKAVEASTLQALKESVGLFAHEAKKAGLVQAIGDLEFVKAKLIKMVKKTMPSIQKEGEISEKVTPLLDFTTYLKTKEKNLALRDTTKKSHTIHICSLEGEIIGGDHHQMGKISEKKAIQRLRSAAKGCDMLVVVLNTPGGDALASANIGMALTQLRREGVPTIAVKHDICASGGEWIAFHADKIWTYSSSIVGSIGVFGIFFNIGPLLKKRLMITIDGPQTKPSSDLKGALLSRDLTFEERHFFSRHVELLHNQFIVLTKRKGKLTKEAATLLAQGQLFTGQQSVNLGLADQVIEDLEAAIAKEVKVRQWGSNYKIQYCRNNWDLEDFFAYLLGKKWSNKTLMAEAVSPEAVVNQLQAKQGIRAYAPHGWILRKLS